MSIEEKTRFLVRKYLVENSSELSDINIEDVSVYIENNDKGIAEQVTTNKISDILLEEKSKLQYYLEFGK